MLIGACDRDAASELGLSGLADYADLITAVLSNRSAWDNPTIAFGGSLAGTLAALVRVRYPHLVDMAWASSTPLLGYPGLADQFAWRKQITDDFETLSPGCPDLAREGFRGIVGADTAALGKAIPVCERSFTWNDIQYHLGLCLSFTDFTDPWPPCGCTSDSEVANFEAVRQGALFPAPFSLPCPSLIRFHLRGHVSRAGRWRGGCSRVMASSATHLRCPGSKPTAPR